MKKLFNCLLIISTLNCNVWAQDARIDPDKEFAKAREMAFNNERNKSIQKLNMILDKYPNYNGVRMFLATVYGWEDKFALARKEFDKLLINEPTQKDYWIGSIKNELWANQSITAIELSKKALNIFPKDFDIILLKAKAQKNNGNLKLATKTIKDYLEFEPNNEEALDFIKSMKEDFSTNTFTLAASTDYFSEIYDPMFYYSLSYSKETKLGSIVGRVNVNQKFKTSGTQFEIDAYPSIAEGLYAYVNVGYSNSSIFPSLRYGAQLYKSLPNSFEASVGFRRLKFSSYTDIYTGSLGKYFGNSFIFFTPYLIPSKEGLSKSGNLSYRKYGANEDQYFAINVGMGYSPEINRFGLDVITEPIISLKSQKIGLSNNFKIKNNNNVVGVGLSLQHQESLFDPGQYFWITSFNLSYSLSY
jgi:YaiO family outer membrane protein